VKVRPSSSLSCSPSAVGAEDGAPSRWFVVQGDEADRQHRTSEALADFQKGAGHRAERPGAVPAADSRSNIATWPTRRKTPETTQPLAETALGFARRAVGARWPKMPRPHLNLAVCYAKLTDFCRQARTKLEYSKLIRDETQQSAGARPDGRLTRGTSWGAGMPAWPMSAWS